jgi:hypothetical protein
MMGRMMVLVPSPASFPEENRPSESQQCDQAYRAEDKKAFTSGGIGGPP